MPKMSKMSEMSKNIKKLPVKQFNLKNFLTSMYIKYGWIEF